MTHQNSTSKAPRGLVLALLLTATALGLFTPRSAAAQSEAPDCLAIVAEMLTPSPSTGAIRASAGCPSSGPVTLASRWMRRGARSAAERTALVEASSLMRDGRLYDAILGVTKDDSHAAADRLAGIRVLLSYAGSGAGGGVIQQGQAARPAQKAQPSTSVDGGVALSPNVRADVKREMYQLANNDDDPDVRYAAKKASASLGYVVRNDDPAAP